MLLVCKLVSIYIYIYIYICVCVCPKKENMYKRRKTKENLIEKIPENNKNKTAYYQTGGIRID